MHLIVTGRHILVTCSQIEKNATILTLNKKGCPTFTDGEGTHLVIQCTLHHPLNYHQHPGVAMTQTLGDGVLLGHLSPLVNPKEGATTDAMRNGERRHHIIKLRIYIWENYKGTK